MSTTADGYKSTLQLPQTNFPMRAGLPKAEPQWLAHWDQIGVYDRLRRSGEGRPVFVLHDGPPYANGHLHIGHALNKILKDMVVRSQQMMGKDSRFVPGWDCHGLPIEWKIEEQYRARDAKKDDVPIVELRAECRRFAERWVTIQGKEFRRLGVTGDWKNPYLTMDFSAEAVIAAEFMKFVMNGVLYQGYKPVLWSTVEKTALAEAEVEYKDHKSDAVWVRFPVDSDRNNIGSDVSVLIWTTTPWTIPSNRAICFNPTIEYSLYEVHDAPEANWLKAGVRLLIADSLVDHCMKKARVAGYERLRSVETAELNGIVCRHPLNGRVASSEPKDNRWDFQVPLLEGSHVTAEQGTGFVHTAPSHGDDDYRIGCKHDLGMPDNVLEDGSFRTDMPLFGGHTILTENGKEGTANKAVIAAIYESGYLAARERIFHSYPHSWRSKAPLIYRCTRQWFAAIDKPVGDGNDKLGKTIRERALNAVKNEVDWTPSTGRNRLFSMLEHRPDWVLSRQRAWGVPLTCFVKRGAKPQDSDFLLRDHRVNERIVQAFRDEGADAWYHDDAKERFLAPDYNPEEYDKVSDILDVWFDSGSTHAFVLRDRNDGPEDNIADLYLEGTDQHRGWFHASLLQSCGTRGTAPYRGVLTHGFTLDERGIKMAKSVGNTISPEEIVQANGADILRLWAAQSDYRTDLRIGQEILKGVTDSYRRIRNGFRFILGNLFDFESGNTIELSEMPELERWVLHRVYKVDQEVRKGYNAFDFQRVFQVVFSFVNSDLSSFYFDIRKDTLYCESADGKLRRSAQTVLDVLHRHLSTWLAPILTFTAEEIWLARFPGEYSSVHLQDFPATPSNWLDEQLAKRWEKIRTVRRAVTAALETQRRDKVIGSSLDACPNIFLEDQDTYNILAAVDFADICITSAVRVSTETPPADTFSIPEVAGVYVQVGLADGRKCQRCWKILPDVGTSGTQNVCGRCNKVLAASNIE